jgi:lipopolysaccharide/colanic/teichoic acid biosynthesis glycosyltransferase
MLSPLLALIAIMIKLDDAGPVLFTQVRVGVDGRTFRIFKFRTMVSDAEALKERLSEHNEAAGVLFKMRADPRITAVGSWLRRWSLDELPQLLNVVRGEMSVIGPRPERPEFVELFRQDVARYGDRHRVKSGITGWAQVHGLRGQTSLAERVEWDNYYIAHWSLALDLKILALTLGALLRNAE